MKNKLTIGIIAFFLAILVGVLLFWPRPEPGFEPAPTATFTATVKLTLTPTLIPSTPTNQAPTSTSTQPPTPTSTQPPTATPLPTPTRTPTVGIPPTVVVVGCQIRPGTIYIIEPGDTLWDIADCAYGDPLRFEELFEANPQLTSRHLIHAGNPLIIPHDR